MSIDELILHSQAIRQRTTELTQAIRELLDRMQHDHQQQNHPNGGSGRMRPN